LHVQELPWAAWRVKSGRCGGCRHRNSPGAWVGGGRRVRVRSQTRIAARSRFRDAARAGRGWCSSCANARKRSRVVPPDQRWRPLGFRLLSSACADDRMPGETQERRRRDAGEMQERCTLDGPAEVRESLVHVQMRGALFCSSRQCRALDREHGRLGTVFGGCKGKFGRRCKRTFDGVQRKVRGDTCSSGSRAAEYLCIVYLSPQSGLCERYTKNTTPCRQAGGVVAVSPCNCFL
jgi:hypothetical protein